MKKYNYNNEIYLMYEEEYQKNLKLINKQKSLRLENFNLKYELEYKSKSFEKKLKFEIEKAIAPLKEQNDILKNKLNDAHEEINRLKTQINNETNVDNKYIIDKLESKINKDSSNSGIPTSKEIKKAKTGTNHITIERKVVPKMVDNMDIKAKL